LGEEVAIVAGLGISAVGEVGLLTQLADDDFRRTNLDGDLHSVRFSHKRLIGPNEWRKVDGEFDLH
jgi:uncharacterized protein Usg